MTLLTLYQVWCVTQEKYKSFWSTSIPLISPIDGGLIASNIFNIQSTDIGDIITISSNDSPYTLDSSIGFNIDSSGGDIILNLPSIFGNISKIYNITKTSSLNTVTIIPNGSETINGDLLRVLTFNGEILTISVYESNWSDDYSLIIPSDLGVGISSIKTSGTGNSLYSKLIGNNIYLKSLISDSNNLTISNSKDTLNFSVSQPTCLELSSTSVATVGTSSTYTIIPGMITTPEAGSYLLLFCSSISIDSSNKIIGICIYVNDTLIQFSEITGSIQRSILLPIQTQAKITVNGSETVSVRWKIDGGTLTIFNRSFNLLQVSP